MAVLASGRPPVACPAPSPEPASTASRPAGIALLRSYEGLRQEIQRLAQENEELRRLVQLIQENQELKLVLKNRGSGLGFCNSGFLAEVAASPRLPRRRTIKFKDAEREQMGRILQRTAVSTNIKERLDFSCALFGPDGGLVSNAPHIPVHLGAMQETVQFQTQHLGADLHPGDVLLSNHPSAGGSHLPDLTVITPANAELAVRDMLRAFGTSRQARGLPLEVTAEDHMDDGSPIRLRVQINLSQGSAVFDFSGTGPEVFGNLNAPRAITLSALIYCLRCLVGRDIPLNQCAS
ncbi:5-oxoprolinase [Tupaia chinensis]|uniref:5-oxoprolinase n=1 Tax=Tupaia chinensis TaxID=246437 RepID=L9KKA7_TUPCH|nr:5-oxoprolinase [Tupaia chinensis]